MGSDFLEKDKVVFTKNDLKDGDVVTLRNGCKAIYIDTGFVDYTDNKSDLCDVSSIKNDLSCDSCACFTDSPRNNDIIKVERPTQYKIMYERKEEVKEMTLAQVCEELGYNVKIIKEE